MSWNYELPSDRIAQRPASFNGERSSSRLLIARRRGEPRIEASVFSNLYEYLRRGDLLVLNDSAVAKTRYFIPIDEDRSAQVEIFIVSIRSTNEDRSAAEVTALARPMKKLKDGAEISLSEKMKAAVLGRSDRGDELRLRISRTSGSEDIRDLIFSEGNTPIPIYIRSGRPDESDDTLYQTVYAGEKGSVAAPTAGLHFTTKQLSDLANSGVNVAFLTHHVGRASFLTVDPVADATVPEERFFIPAKTVSAIESAQRGGNRVVVVGTTSTRALESFARGIGANVDGGFGGETDLFIRPGFEFQIVNALITNFHQPETTHISLVSAFAGEQLVRDAYEFALREDFRFLSYGDSMFIE